MCEKNLTVKQLNQPPAGDRIRRELLPYRCCAAVCAQLKPQCQQVVGAWHHLEELDETPPPSDPSWAEPARRERGSVEGTCLEEETPKGQTSHDSL